MKVQAKHGKVTQNMHGARRNYRFVWDVSPLYLNFKFTTVGFAAQGIGHYISFARGIGNIHVEVGYCLEPSLLAEIQVWLSKQILQTLVVGVDLATITEKVMSPQLQCIDYCCQFEIMRWIVIFVRT